jgi:hypothetical protein
MQATALNVGNLKTYLEGTASLQLRTLLSGSNVDTIYIADLRNTNVYITSNYTVVTTTPATTNTTSTTYPSSYVPGTVVTNYNTKNKITGYTYLGYKTAQLPTNVFAYTAEPAIILTNGATLPATGLTIATPDPVYIWGNYNVSTDGTNLYTATSSTTHTRPASVLCDAITILSANFSISKSTNALSSRTATTTTINTALLAGNVPTTTGVYSGGFENFTRLLENWSGVTLYYNGSMVLMFESQIADGTWGKSDVYNPATRTWTFDNNFLNTANLPPASPQISSFAKGKWRQLTSGTYAVP